MKRIGQTIRNKLNQVTLWIGHKCKPGIGVNAHRKQPHFASETRIENSHTQQPRLTSWFPKESTSETGEGCTAICKFGRRSAEK